MTYHGKYRVQHAEKYKGDPTKVTYRSLWERQVFRWLDANSKVVWWNSEELVIPYYCMTDKKQHRYFVDVQVQFNKGPIRCIEIKPAAQTIKPEKKQGKRRSRYLQEATTYAKNYSKWMTARGYCEKRGWVFEIWTEHTLTALGIRILRAAHVKKKKTNRNNKPNTL